MSYERGTTFPALIGVLMGMAIIGLLELRTTGCAHVPKGFTGEAEAVGNCGAPERTRAWFDCCAASMGFMEMRDDQARKCLLWIQVAELE